MIATGHRRDFGNTSGTYLKPGDTIDPRISQIGALVSPVIVRR